MPKVALTEAQKRAQTEARRRETLADGLQAYKGRKGFTNVELGENLGIGRIAVAGLLDRKPVRLDTDQMFRVILAAGLRISCPAKDLGEG